jgi:energy-coupling factor transporter ATP-binding protein EcfA2
MKEGNILGIFVLFFSAFVKFSHNNIRSVIMLVDFALRNFRSFRNEVMLSMSPVKRLTGEEKFDETHLIKTKHPEKERLLKSAAIYGANASGKSNLLHGLLEMQSYVLSLVNPQEIGSVQRRRSAPFAFSGESQKNPVAREVQILLDRDLYRYGFEILDNAVSGEWLYRNGGMLFDRQNGEFDLGEGFEEGSGKESQTRWNTLFLSVCHAYNGKVSTQLIDRFFTKIRKAHPFSPVEKYFAKEKIKERLLGLIRITDTGISDFQEQRKMFSASSTVNFYEVLTVTSYNVLYNCVGPDNSLDISELSDGTLQLIAIASEIFRAMDEGNLVIIDELDLHLHPLLVETLLKIFHMANQSEAQMIFTTHNTYPLRRKLLRRDQVWLLNKLDDLSSQLVNFSEFKVRPDASFEKDYLNGRFGGVPIIDLPDIFNGDQDSEEAE